MKEHMMMMHTGDKPFKCNQCNYARIHSGDLWRHMMKHSGVKPFPVQQIQQSLHAKEPAPIGSNVNYVTFNVIKKIHLQNHMNQFR